MVISSKVETIALGEGSSVDVTIQEQMISDVVYDVGRLMNNDVIASVVAELGELVLGVVVEIDLPVWKGFYDLDDFVLDLPVVVAQSPMKLLEVQGHEQLMHKLGIRRITEITSMENDIVVTDCLVPVGDHREIHLLNIHERATRELESPLLTEVSVGREEHVRFAIVDQIDSCL